MPSARHDISRHWDQLIETGRRQYILSDGSWGMLDMLSHAVLSSDRGLRLRLCAYAVSMEAVNRLAFWRLGGRLSAIDIVVDESMARLRKSEWASMQRKMPGIVTAMVHAKFWVLHRADGSKVFCSSSANLNLNRRVESFDIGSDSEVCDVMDSFISGALANAPKRHSCANASRERGLSQILGLEE